MNDKFPSVPMNWRPTAACCGVLWNVVADLLRSANYGDSVRSCSSPGAPLHPTFGTLCPLERGPELGDSSPS